MQHGAEPTGRPAPCEDDEFEDLIEDPQQRVEDHTECRVRQEGRNPLVGDPCAQRLDDAVEHEERKRDEQQFENRLHPRQRHRLEPQPDAQPIPTEVPCLEGLLDGSRSVVQRVGADTGDTFGMDLLDAGVERGPGRIDRQVQHRHCGQPCITKDLTVGQSRFSAVPPLVHPCDRAAGKALQRCQNASERTGAHAVAIRGRWSVDIMAKVLSLWLVVFTDRVTRIIGTSRVLLLLRSVRSKGAMHDG